MQRTSSSSFTYFTAHVFVFVACSSATDESPAAVDSPTQVAGMGAASCASEADAAEVAMVPEFWTAFNSISSPCQTLPTGVLLKNVGDGPLRIDGMMVNVPELAIEVEELPVELAAEAFLPVRFRFLSRLEGPSEGTVTVATSAGCRKLRAYGLAVPGALQSRSAEAVDFGSVAPGQTVTRRVTSLHQRSSDDPSSTLLGFGTDDQGFQLVSAPAEGPLESCVPAFVDLEFRAPQTQLDTPRQHIEGTLGWDSHTITPDGEFSGFTTVSLHAATGLEP
jgi:hypothetical protein